MSNNPFSVHVTQSGDGTYHGLVIANDDTHESWFEDAGIVWSAPCWRETRDAALADAMMALTTLTGQLDWVSSQ